MRSPTIVRGAFRGTVRPTVVSCVTTGRAKARSATMAQTGSPRPTMISAMTTRGPEIHMHTTTTTRSREIRHGESRDRSGPMKSTPPTDEMEMYNGHFDGTIEDVVLHGGTILSAYAHVLVTCLDSIRDVAGSATGRLVLERFPRCAAYGKGVLIPGESVEAVHQSVGLFTGFDELWCFTTVPSEEKPAGVSVLPPPGFDEEAPDPNTIAWISQNGCHLALGDGFGLNYVTVDRETESALRGLF